MASGDGGKAQVSATSPYMSRPTNPRFGIDGRARRHLLNSAFLISLILKFRIYKTRSILYIKQQSAAKNVGSMLRNKRRGLV